MIIYNSIIPFKGFKACSIFPFIFIRKEYKGKVEPTLLEHERTHFEQQKEMLFVFFYLWYAVEWLIRFVKYRDARLAYKRISLEQECYWATQMESYHKWRKHYAWIEFLKY